MFLVHNVPVQSSPESRGSIRANMTYGLDLLDKLMNTVFLLGTGETTNVCVFVADLS